MEYLKKPIFSKYADQYTSRLRDTYLHKGLRRKLVDKLRGKGIHDERVLKAMMDVPRHFFLDAAFDRWAYEDKAFPIGHEQTISQPFTVAYMTQLLDVQPRQKVLEVGTGSGYQAAVLARMGARVFTIERQEALYRDARARLEELGYRVRCFYRDGYKGLPEFAPFERILVTAGAREMPEALKEQLAIRGVMVIPVGEASQAMHRVIRLSETAYADEISGRFKFVPFLGGLEASD